ncbi:hypothetical protein JST97_36925 [bacterium]|nr:hypothetical protein [bacterium]
MKIWGHYSSRNAESGLKRPAAEVYLDNSEQKLPWLALQRAAPEAAEQIQRQASQSEQRLGQAVQTHFRIEDGKLELEPFQPLPCSPSAALKIRVQMVSEGLLSQSQALQDTSPECLRLMLLSRLKGSATALCRGQGNGWGACSGQVAHDYAGCLRLHNLGRPVILVTDRLGYAHRDCLDLISGALIFQAPGLALDQLQKPCILSSPQPLSEGQWLSLDSQSGQVFAEAMSVQAGVLSTEARTLLEWADQHRSLEIRANASHLEDLKLALDWGAGGVGLFRLDTLILNPRLLDLFQTCLGQICCSAITSSSEIDQLTEQLTQECAVLFQAAGPVGFNLRLLDAPVSLMLRYWKESGRLSQQYWTDLLRDWLQELSPTQGLRCGRLGILFPCLWGLQMRACLRAARDHPVQLQIMLPGVSDARELELARELCAQICQQERLPMPRIGSMLEIPRACLTADQLAPHADFLSFGTGDLTETTCGISRYDSCLSFLPEFLRQGVFPKDPFQSIDQPGVGALMEIASRQLKAHRPRLELGTCGAQAAEPASLEFCLRLGLDYVSLPARHIPVARLVAAQILLNEKNAPVP